MTLATSLAAGAVRVAGGLSPGWGAALALPLFARVSPPRPVDPSDEATMDRAIRSSVRIPGIDGSGTDVAVYAWGRPDGAVVALAHGWNGRAAQWATLVRELVSDGCRVVAFDAPAHGTSPGRGSYLVDWIDILDAVQADSGRLAAVVGHSFGGLGALLAAGRGLAVDRVITVAAAGDADVLLSQFQGAVGFGEATAAELRRRFARRYFPGESDPFDALSPLRHPLAPGSRLLVVHDEEDRAVPFGEARRIVAANPGAELLATRGLGHTRILRADPFLDAVLELVSAPAAAASDNAKREVVTPALAAAR